MAESLSRVERRQTLFPGKKIRKHTSKCSTEIFTCMLKSSLNLSSADFGQKVGKVNMHILPTGWIDKTYKLKKSDIHVKRGHPSLGPTWRSQTGRSLITFWGDLTECSLH